MVKGNREIRVETWFERGLVGILCSLIVGGTSWCTASCVKQKLSMDCIVRPPLRGGIINGSGAMFFFFRLIRAHISRHHPPFRFPWCLPPSNRRETSFFLPYVSQQNGTHWRLFDIVIEEGSFRDARQDRSFRSVLWTRHLRTDFTLCLIPALKCNEIHRMSHMISILNSFPEFLSLLLAIVLLIQQDIYARNILCIVIFD